MQFRRTALAACAAALLLPLPALGTSPAPSARLQPWLAGQLAQVQGPLRVYVHGATADDAQTAARAAGLAVVERFEQVGVVVADGSAAAVRRVTHRPRVTYVEGDQPAALLLDRVHRATRNAEAQEAFADLPGGGLSGRGVSVAVIDTGVDGTHPFFRGAEGASKVVVNLKSVCHQVAAVAVDVNAQDACWAPVLSNDSDSASMGGHGTHVAGIVAGVPTKVRWSVNASAERTLSGAAPGATVVALSVGQVVSMYGGNTGLNWVLNHHAAPCGPAVSAAACPPIRVTNNSYGPTGGSQFDPEGVTAKLQRALVDAGVVTVWAAGNDGGDGSGKDVAGRYAGTNGPGNDPTPGILMAASYDDKRRGSRDDELSSFSSRGIKGKPETYPDLAAPGDGITSACRPQLAVCGQGFDPWDGPGPSDLMTFNTISGTSMAAPYVAGVVAELLQLDPTLTPGQVEIALENGAHPFTAGGAYESDPTNPGSPTSFDKGHGLVDVLASAELVRAGGIVVPAPPAKPIPPLFVPPRGVVTCSTAYTDPKGDATDFDGVARPNRPALDLRAGRFSWDGDTLTVAFLVDDLGAMSTTPGDSEYYSWEVQPAHGDPFQVVTATGTLGVTFLSRSGDTASLRRSTPVDLPGTGADEVRVRITNEELQALPGENPQLVAGLALRTGRVYSAEDVVVAPFQADVAQGGSCSYVVGAADTPAAKPKAKPAKR